MINDNYAIPRLMSGMVEAFQNDPEYAWSWHCNLAMSFYDAMNKNVMEHDELHRRCNDGAARFMKLAFGADVEKYEPTDSDGESIGTETI